MFDDYIPDYTEQHAEHEAREEIKHDRWLKKRPKCSCCEEPIMEEFFYRIIGFNYCAECHNDNFRVDTDDYIQE